MSKNTFKTYVLLAGLGGMLVLVGSFFGRGGAVIGSAIGLVFVGASYWFSDKIAIRSARVVPVTEQEMPEYYRIVRELTAEAGMPMPKLYVTPDLQPNAFATGRNPQHAAVAVTQGILRLLNWDELRGVLAHEISHVGNRDILIGSVAAVVAMGITFVARMAMWGAMFGGGSSDDDGGVNPIALLAFSILAPLAAAVLQMALSRSREYEADRSGARLIRDGEPLARALEKLEQGARAIPMDVDPVQASKYIVNPLTGRKVQFANLFTTHPPLADRAPVSGPASGEADEQPGRKRAADGERMGVVSRRARFALAFGPTLAGLISGGVWSARAATPPPQVAFAQQSPPTTANLLEALLQTLFPTTTTAPPPAAATAPPAPGDPGAAPAPSGDSSGTDTTEPVADGVVPPEAQVKIDSVLRSGSNNNLGLLAALHSLTDQGLSTEEAAIIGMGQFPVAGEAYWSDDWWMPRFTPTFHLHMGTDIFAAWGTPVRAPEDGYLSDNSGGAGGLAAQITTADGTYYYMAHLNSFADARSGPVKRGEVVGFVGTSGNAEGGSPHLHFEIHPGGGGAVNPKPTLDRWINEAMAAVPDLLGEYRVGGLPRPLTAAGLLRRLDVGSLGAPVSSDGPQLWTTSARRENGALRVTEVAAVNGEPAPFDPMLRGAQAKAIDQLRAEQMARDVLGPLTPKVLDGIAHGSG